MAQGSSKSRIIIWALVGILVVVAAIMLISKPKTSQAPPINAERFVRQQEGRFQKLEKRISAAQADFPGAPAEQWQKMGDEIARGRQIMAEMPGLTEQKDLEAKKIEVQKAYTGTRKMLKDVTGKEDKEDKEEGGE
jgi:hypothetical protein